MNNPPINLDEASIGALHICTEMGRVFSHSHFAYSSSTTSPATHQVSMLGMDVVAAAYPQIFSFLCQDHALAINVKVELCKAAIANTSPRFFQNLYTQKKENIEKDLQKRDRKARSAMERNRALSEQMIVYWLEMLVPLLEKQADVILRSHTDVAATGFSANTTPSTIRPKHM